MPPIKGHNEIVSLLLDKGSKPNIESKSKLTALRYAVISKNSLTVKTLIESGAGVNLKDIFGTTALIDAGDKGNVMVVQMLLNAGEKVNAVDGEGKTALMNASSKGYEKIVSLLLNAGAKPNIESKSKLTALYYAVISTKPSIVKTLIENGADVNYKDSSGKTVLIVAAGNSHNTRIIQTLLNAGASVNVVDNEGETALMNASGKGHNEVISLLLGKGANPNIISNSKFAALHYAIQKKKFLTVKILVESGADVHQKDTKEVNRLLQEANSPTTVEYKKTTDVQRGEAIFESLKKNATFHGNSEYIDHFKKEILNLTKENKNVVANIYNILSKGNKENEEKFAEIVQFYIYFLQKTYAETNNFFHYVFLESGTFPSIKQIMDEEANDNVILSKELILLNIAFKEKSDAGNEPLRKMWDKRLAISAKVLEEQDRKIAKIARKGEELDRDLEVIRRLGEAFQALKGE